MAEERLKREKVRRHIVEEFVSTERSYIEKLRFLKKVRSPSSFVLYFCLYITHYFTGSTESSDHS